MKEPVSVLSISPPVFSNLQCFKHKIPSSDSLPPLPLKNLIDSRPTHEIINELVLKNTDNDSFFVADLGNIERQLALFRRLLPRVEPFYAMKCNPDPLVVRILA